MANSIITRTKSGRIVRAAELRPSLVRLSPYVTNVRVRYFLNACIHLQYGDGALQSVAERLNVNLNDLKGLIMAYKQRNV